MSFISKAGRAAIKNLMTIQELDELMDRRWGRPTVAGVPVSENLALTFSEVQKCVNLLARTEGCLETKVYKWDNTAHTKKVEATDHPLYELLFTAPNNETDAQSFVETESLFLSLYGNFGAEITRNSSRNRNITELYQWKWWEVRVKRDENGTLYYEHKEGAQWEQYPAEKIFHINTMAWDGVVGLSTIGMARETVAQGLAAQQFCNRFYGRGMHMGGIISVPGSLSDEAKANIKKAALEMAGGLGNSWEPYVLEDGVEWDRIPMSFVDAQFIETAKLNCLDIDGIFGVPPPLVGNSYQGLTYNTVEQVSLNYVLYTLLPIVTRRERMINWKLLTRQEREAGYFVKTNLNTLLRADAVSRAKYFRDKSQSGAMSPNDWKLEDDENPIGDPSGDEYYANGNYRTLKQICLHDIAQKGGNEK
jgi:HK97 family phage portal protein